MPAVRASAGGWPACRSAASHPGSGGCRPGSARRRPISAARAEAVAAGQRQDRIVAELLEEPDELPAPGDVAVDDDGAGYGLAGHEPGEDRDDLARAGEWLPRLERDQGPRGGELDPPARGRQSASTSGFGPAAGRQGACGRSPAPGPRRPRRPGRTCRRRWPPRTTAPSTSGPAASGGGERAGRVGGGERGEPDALDRLLQRQAQEGDLRRHVRRVEPQRLARKPQAEVRLGVALRHPVRDRDRLAGVPGPEDQGGRRETRPRGGDNASASSVSTRTGARGCAANGRPVSRSIARRASSRTGSLVSSVPAGDGVAAHARYVRCGTAPGRRCCRARPPHRRPRPASGLSRVAIKGGNRRPVEPAHVADDQGLVLGREPRLLERLHQKRHGVRPRLAEPLDGVVLLLVASSSGRR